MVWGLIASSSAALAQQPMSERAKRREARRAARKDTVPPDAEKKIKDLEKKAQGVSWDAEAQNIHQAHRLVFANNNWNSESDQFALGLLDQVTNIAPWQGHEREEVFLNGIQARLNLTGEQRQMVADSMRKESMGIAGRHFKTLFPVVMEAVQTRLEQKPFTAEQVQKWSQNLKPVMDDALAAVERVQREVEKTMNEDQKRQLRADMDALVRRHHDVEKMVKRWQAGNWNPTDWGLDNDPIHASAMMEYRRVEAQRNNLVRAVEAQQPAALPAVNGDDASEWDKYVQWFKQYYGCDAKQCNSADAILKSCKKEASDYLGARGREIEKYETDLKTADSDTKKQYLQAEIKRLKKPIGDIFVTLCRRLDQSILTSEQRKKSPAAKPPAQADTAQAKASRN